jgi:HIRAN domain
MGDQFTRRAVNSGLIALAVSLSASRPALRRPATPLFDFAIAGGWYHGLREARTSIVNGELLQLRAEPDNPHDAHAVAVCRAGLLLGYIPRAANAPVARLLGEGADIRCEVVGRPATRASG